MQTKQRIEEQVRCTANMGNLLADLSMAIMWSAAPGPNYEKIHRIDFNDEFELMRLLPRAIRMEANYVGQPI